MTAAQSHQPKTRGEVTVRVHSMPTLEPIERDRIYFTFASGSLTYDCVSCGARCCRGYGYELVGTPLIYQLQARPALKLFLDADPPATGAGYRVTNCPPACFFLSPEGRCEVHEQAGFALKPETCRLFPFNRIRLAGEYLIVSPHNGLCPLHVMGHDAGSPRSLHEVLLGELAAQGLRETIPIALSSNGPLGEVISLERRIVDLVPAFLANGSATAFVAAQVSAQSPVAGAARSTSLHGSVEARVSTALTTMSRVLGVTEPLGGAGDLTVARAIIAMTPTFRAELLFPEGELGGERRALERERLPYFILALYLIACQAKAAGLHDITPQTLFRLFQQFRSLLYVLAYADCVVAWNDNVSLSLRRSGDEQRDRRMLRLSRELLPSQQRKQQRTLSEVLLAHLDAPIPDRIVAFKRLARRLEGRIGTGSVHGSSENGTTPHWRHRLQRWILANVSKSVLREVTPSPVGRER